MKKFIRITALALSCIAFSAMNMNSLPPINTYAESGSTVPGDINGDGEFSIADLVILERYLIGGNAPSYLQNADFCKDGIIDVYDMCMMRKEILTASGSSVSMGISINGGKELRRLRNNLELPDEEFEKYLASLTSSPDLNREDAEIIIRIADTLPCFNIVNGDMTWFAVTSEQNDETNEKSLKIYLTFENENREWITFEYYLFSNTICTYDQLIEELKAVPFEEPLISSKTSLELTGEIINENSINIIGAIEDIPVRIVSNMKDTENVKNLLLSADEQIPADFEK